MTVSLDGYRGTGIPVKLGRTPGGVRSTPPLFGSSTRRILAEAGYDAAEVEALLEEGIAFEERRKPPA
jgi:crotonobetainyl-CoA:carnitine CoA-transferase CaiB-like acyl-CoA transferase